MDLVNVQKAAEALGCSKSFLYRQAAAGHLPVFRVGRGMRFDLLELREALRSRMQKDKDIRSA